MLFLVSFALVHVGPLARGQISDTWIYQRAGDAIVHHGQVPYRDFPLEYPPGALPTFVLPSVLEPITYARSFQVEMCLCGLAAVLAAAAALRAAGMTPREALLPVAVIGLSPLLVGPLMLSRFDLWPAALTALAVAALATRRDRAGAVALGVAIATKLYAAALLPLAAIGVWRRRGRAAALRFCGLSAVVVGAIFLPFAVVAPSGVLEPLSRQVHRPLQVESLGAAILIAVHQITGMHIRSYGLMGSDNLASPGAGTLATGFTAVGLLGVAGVYLAYVRGPMTRARLCIAAAAAVTFLVAFAKVLSPQYMLWLVPLVPLAAGGRRGRVALLLLAGVLVLTQTWYPRHYAEMANQYHQPETWLLLVRDVLLVVLAGVLTAGLVRRKDEALRPPVVEVPPRESIAYHAGGP